MLKPDQMPAPDALIQYPDGSIGPAMFHYLDEDDPVAWYIRTKHPEARS